MLSFNKLGRSVSLSAVAAAVLFLCFSAGGSSAQLRVEGYGLRFGYNTGSLYAPYSTFDNQVQWNVYTRGINYFSGASGFHIGVSADMPFTEFNVGEEKFIVGLNPSAMFVSKGVSRNTTSYLVSSLGTRGKYTIDAYFLDIPIPLSVKKEFPEYNIAIRAELGPYISFGLFGSTVYSVPAGPLKFKQPSFGDEGLDRVDGGIFYGAIVEFANNFFVGLRSGAGLTDYEITSYYLTIGYTIKN